MKYIGFLLAFFGLFAQPGNSCCADVIPCLSFQDLKALYPRTESVFNLDWPTATKLPNEQKIIEDCEQDFSQYYRTISGKQIPSNVKDSIVLFRVSRNPDNSIVYLIFEIDPDRVNDLMIVYFLNSTTNRLILKMLL
jgi:hypothetical protein